MKMEAFIMTRVAIAGGTGLVGRYATEALCRAGHETVTLARATGVDLLAGAGLADALRGVRAVIDVTNTAAASPDETRAFFGAVTGNLLAAELRAGVGHHVALSIAGVDRIAGNAHYAGKRLQEELVMDGPVAATIVRATQFHEFPAQVLTRTQRGPIALMFRGRSQPVAAREVGRLLVEVATAPARDGGRIEVAGPAVEELPEMARKLLAARGSKARVIPIPLPGAAGRAMRAGSLLPSPAARISGPTFDDWLQSADARRTGPTVSTGL